MKQKKILYYLLLLFITVIALWLVPALVRKATYSPDSYPFVYYSSMMKALGVIDYKDKVTPLSDLQGNRYTTAQFDSLMPLLNFRQLMSDGRLPDSINGIEITPPLLRSKSVVFRYSPNQLNTPDIGLYILFESMPKRVGLEMPDDLFRMDNGIAFIDAESNSIHEEKSQRFQQALDKAGYQFPARLMSGNPNPRKAYDEGYFSLDAKGDLFHIKMVNGRPYVRDTKAGREINIGYFSILEVSDKRFYGFIFSKEGDVYILESDEGGYRPLKLDIAPIDITKDQFNIMGNLLYWTVWVTTPQGRLYYGLETQSLRQLASHAVEREENRWDQASRLLFPYTLTFESTESDYLAPRLTFTGIWAFGINLVLAVVAVFTLSGSRKQRLFYACYTIVTGIAGFIALWILPKNNKNNAIK